MSDTIRSRAKKIPLESMRKEIEKEISEKEIMSGKKKSLTININYKHLSIKYSIMNNLEQ